jgi:uncharacterized protein YPO0396
MAATLQAVPETVARMAPLHAERDAIVAEIARLDANIEAIRAEEERRVVAVVHAHKAKREDLNERLRVINREMRAAEYEGEAAFHRMFFTIAHRVLDAMIVDDLVARTAQSMIEQHGSTAPLGRERHRPRVGDLRVVNPGCSR